MIEGFAFILICHNSPVNILPSLLLLLLLQGYSKSKMTIIHVRYDLAHSTTTTKSTHSSSIHSKKHTQHSTQFTHSIYFFCLLSFFVYIYISYAPCVLLLLPLHFSLSPLALLLLVACFIITVCAGGVAVVVVLVVIAALLFTFVMNFSSHTIRCYFTIIYLFSYTVCQICLGRYVKVI